MSLFKKLCFLLFILFSSFLVACDVQQGEVDENGIPPFGNFVANIDFIPYSPFLTTVFTDIEPDTTSILVYSVKLIPNSLIIDQFILLFVTQVGSDSQLGEYPLLTNINSPKRAGVAFFSASDSTIWMSTSGSFTVFSIDTVGRDIIKATFNSKMISTNFRPIDVQPSLNEAFISSLPLDVNSNLALPPFGKEQFMALRQLTRKRSDFASTPLKAPQIEEKSITDGGLHLDFLIFETTYETNQEPSN